MKYASIDVGTNSCRMLIVDESFQIIKKDLQITRLGEGVDENRLLTDAAIERTYSAIAEFLEEAENLNVEKTRIIGTSALRDVNNAKKLVNRVKKNYQLEFDIISGEEEARLNYLANRYQELNPLIIDIGGGSTEFIWKNEDRIIFKSLDMGSVRMTERFLENSESTVSTAEIEKIKDNCTALISNKLDIKVELDQLIGLGGTITTLAAIDLSMEEYEADKIESYILKKDIIEQVLDKLSSKTLSERKKTKGLQPGRADVIIAGTVVLLTIMEVMDFNQITVSEYDLLYGVIEDILQRKNSR